MAAEARTRLTMEDEASPVLHDFEGRLARLGRTVGGVTGRFGGLLNVGRVLGTGLMRLEISSLALSNAQDRLTLSQDRLNEAVAKYGPLSAEARRAQKELEISTRSLDIAQQRMMIREAFLWMTIIPEVVGSLRGGLGLGRLFRGGAGQTRLSQFGFGGGRGLGGVARGLAGGAVGAIAGAGMMAGTAMSIQVYGDYYAGGQTEALRGLQMSQQLRSDRES